ncbi:hypothetical protein GCM10027343_37610 [Noviherbaspirillum agri]
MTRDTAIPTILFGAFDRHNFGDLLFPHVCAALLGRRDLILAGLADRDLRAEGGHKVRSIARLAQEGGRRAVDIVHAGGELLTCNAWQAAVMLLPPHEAKDMIARYDRHPQVAHDWARQQLGMPSLAPYCVPRHLFPHANRIIYNAVGGVELDECETELCAEVLDNLKAADAVGVRDRITHALLLAEGISAHLLPDPASMVAALFGTAICERMSQGELAQVRQVFPQGYVAVQFSADFETAHCNADPLRQIASQLDRFARTSGLGVVFFRAGAAPWHDELGCYAKVAAQMKPASFRLFTSLNIWDICALIAGSRGYLGSSLHGRIVAMAFALPRLNVRHPAHGGRTTKQAAYAGTWDEECVPATVGLDDMAECMQQAMFADPRRLRRKAEQVAHEYRRGFEVLWAS